MKTTLLYLALFTTSLIYSQEIKIDFQSENGIRGKAAPNSVIYFDYNLDSIEDDSVKTDEVGGVNFSFNKTKNKKLLRELKQNDSIWIWNSTNNPIRTLGTKTIKIERSLESLENKTLYTNALILSTNFNIPVARFNFIDEKDRTDAIGNINLFTSVGAGFGIHWGEKKDRLQLSN